MAASYQIAYRPASTQPKKLDSTPEVCQIATADMKLLLALTDQSFTATKSVGIFNVSMGLAKGLMQVPEVTELHILGNNECAPYFQQLPAHVHLHLAEKPVPQRFSRVWWDQAGVSAAIRKINPDWAILPKGFPPFFPMLGKTKLACYLHDVNWEYYEKTTKDGDSPFPRHELLYFRALGLRCLKIADLVLTSTQFNKSRYEHYCPDCHTAVVGIGFDDTPRVYSPSSGRDILFYASPFPHKLTSLGIQRVEAWLNQRADAGDIRIHLIGRLPGGLETPGAHWLSHGRLPGEELQRIMHEDCRCAIYFSDYEGFGMPPVECLRSGIPCIASALPPICENIPERFTFDNADEADFIRTLNNAYDSPDMSNLPHYPTWQEVARRCTAAMMQRN